MGVGKVAVGALQPLGCLPEVTVLNNFQQCSETSNTAAKFHNMLLRQAGAKLNNESKDSGAFIVLYLFDAFTSVLNHTEATVKFEKPILKQCCVAKAGYSCSNVNAKGEKMYTVCDNPKENFFWDTVHLTQAGWLAVFSALKAKFETS
ncbi:hypothetical protein C3L33_02533, partial [Rhododendron williamsianum]